MDKLQVVYKRVEDLIPYVNNARTHSDEQVSQIAASIKEFGFNNPILLDGSNGVIAGHGRLLAAKKLGLAEAPCIELAGLSEAQKKAYILADNRIALNSGWDNEMLKTELEFLRGGAESLDFIEKLGFSEDELEELLANDISNDDVVEDEPPEPPEEPKSKRGDIWLLGNHRLMCGDSTDAADVALLMNGTKADLLFTDPPYGVSYEKKTKDVLGSSGYTKIQNDDLSGDDFKGFLFLVFSNASTSLKETASYYVFSCQGGDQEMMMMMMMREAGIPCRHQIIWVKDAPVFSMGRLDYDYKHEPILYGWVKRHNFKRKGEQDKSVWEFKRTENKLHPTMKPVELICNALMNSTDKRDVVLDLFGGSGSSVIACEQLDRKCYTMELDTHYCDVIIQRWQNLTNQEAIRESDGATYNSL